MVAGYPQYVVANALAFCSSHIQFEYSNTLLVFVGNLNNICQSWWCKCYDKAQRKYLWEKSSKWLAQRPSLTL